MSNTSLGQVLVVDDDPVLITVIEAFLLDGRAEVVHTAQNGVEATKKLVQLAKKLDFIFCDLNMPDMDGLQFLRQVSNFNYTGPMAIISGEDRSILSLATKLAASLDLNLASAISKPLNFDELDHVIAGARGQIYKPITNPVEKVSEQRLRTALAEQEFTAFYQPKIETSSGRLIGVEALARWKCPNDGWIRPDQFIPVAEKSDLIVELTRNIISVVAGHAGHWHEIGPDFGISINLSANVLSDIDLPNDIEAEFTGNNLDFSKFTFELTESQLLRQNTNTLETLARLSLKGFKLSIDDFGTGFANLEMIRDFPFSELKLDRSFISRATSDISARASAEACIELGKKLDMILVAEGIEKVEDWSFCLERDVDHLQGFLIAKPMPVEDLRKWIPVYNAKAAHLARAVLAMGDLQSKEQSRQNNVA